ncbi:hypothetical protein THAOC_13454, partial [Thalassiosira oceanica]
RRAHPQGLARGSGHRPLFRGKPGFMVYRHLHCTTFSAGGPLRGGRRQLRLPDPGGLRQAGGAGGRFGGEEQGGGGRAEPRRARAEELRGRDQKRAAGPDRDTAPVSDGGLQLDEASRSDDRHPWRSTRR